MLDTITAHLDEIEELCRVHHVRRLSVFGSAVRGDFDPATSDVDLLVEFSDLKHVRYAPNYFSLQRAIAAVLQRNVDLVIADTIRNPVILRGVREDAKVLYAA